MINNVIITIIIIIVKLLFLLFIMPFVPSKRRPKSQYGGRTIFNLITQFDLKYKETTLALGLTSVIVITWKSTDTLLLDCLRTCDK